MLVYRYSKHLARDWLHIKQHIINTIYMQVKRYYNTDGNLVRYEIITTEMRERGRRYKRRERITAFVFQLFVWVAFTLFIAGTYLLATA